MVKNSIPLEEELSFTRFDQMSEKYPGNIAVSYLGEHFTYKRLRQLSERFAGGLQNLNIKKGDKVLYGKYSGTEITVNDKEFLILRESDILAVL